MGRARTFRGVLSQMCQVQILDRATSLFIGGAEVGGEKRQHPRRAVLLECRIDGASGPTATRLSDLSPTGCYVESRNPVSVGASITIRLTFGGALLSLTGRIAHAQPSVGFGMKFDSMSMEVIEAFLEPAAVQMSEAT